MERPVVIVESGRLPQYTDFADKLLRDCHRDLAIYQRGEMLVRAGLADPKDRKNIVRPPGAVVLNIVTVPMLEDALERAVRWQREAKNGNVDVGIPGKLAQRILGRVGMWKVRELTGIVEAPIMRPDGTILSTDGYDEQTGILLQSGISWPALPPPSLDSARAAVATLNEPFREFPYRRPADLSVTISGVVTALQRRSLEAAPAHAFNKPTQGSGGSLQVDCIALIATGRPAASMNANVEEEEFAKKLTAGLLAGDLILPIDNVTRPLRSDALSTIITQPTYKNRILGVSENKALPTNCLVTITGNNLTFTGDMPSRVVESRIEPNCERPEERKFEIEDLRAHVLTRRPQLVTAALTIVQSYFFAGRPDMHLVPCRFAQWSREIRSALVWAGLPDPVETREQIIATDPERDATLAVFENWYSSFGETKKTLRDLVEAADQRRGDQYLAPDLRAALLDIAADRDNPKEINSIRLAAWCRTKVDRVIGEFKLLRGEEVHAGFKTWQVVRVNTDAQIRKEI